MKWFQVSSIINYLLKNSNARIIAANGSRLRDHEHIASQYIATYWGNGNKCDTIRLSCGTIEMTDAD